MTPLVLWLAAAALPGCLTVDGDHILARDLTVAEPAFSALALDTVLGFAPEPGARRVWRAADLARLGARHQMSLAGPRDLCVERVMEDLDPARIRQAMQISLESARVELVDWSRYPAPRGAITFPMGALSAPADRRLPALWRGYVKYGTNRRFRIWGSVRLSVAVERVVARRSLLVGEIIAADAVRVESTAIFPLGPRPAASLEQVLGQVPCRAIAAGDAIFPLNLDAPLAVRAGDAVMVEVASGHMQLSLDGKAAAAGRTGDWIAVRNPATGKTFRARIGGPGRVTVLVGKAAGAPAPGEK